MIILSHLQSLPPLEFKIITKIDSPQAYIKDGNGNLHHSREDARISRLKFQHVNQTNNSKVLGDYVDKLLNQGTVR